MNKNIKNLVAVTVCVTLGTVVGVLAQGFTNSESSSLSGATKASSNYYAANLEEGKTLEYKTSDLNLDSYLGNLGTLSVNTTNNVGFYVVMPWAKNTVSGEYRFKEVDGNIYKDYGWTKSFSKDLAQSNGFLSLDFVTNFEANQSVTFANSDLVENYIDTKNFENLKVGDQIATDRAESPITIVERNGKRALQVISEGHSYTASLDDINWYVIKTAKYTGWHVDGEPTWVDEGAVAVNYTVKYVDANTGEDVRTSLVVNNDTKGNNLYYGDNVVVNSINIPGYRLVSEEKVNLKLTNNKENVVVFKYLPIEVVSEKVGFYVVMPWATNAIVDEDGYLKYAERTGLKYRELGYLKAFSSDISDGTGAINLDFGFEFDKKGNVTFAEESKINSLLTVDFSNLHEGKVIKTEREGTNIKVVTIDGENALEVSYNGDRYTAKVNDIKWYVIKTSSYTDWHVDGAVKWTKEEVEVPTEPETVTEVPTEPTTEKTTEATSEEVTEPTSEVETETELESQTEVTSEDETKATIEVDGEEDTREEVTEPTTEVTTEATTEATKEALEATKPEVDVEVAGDEDEVTKKFIEVSSSEDKTQNNDSFEVAGDEDLVEIETTVVKDDQEFLAQVAGDEDLVAEGTVQTSDNASVLVWVILMVLASATAAYVKVKKTIIAK